MEGYTNAAQDRLFHTALKQKKKVSPFQLQFAMNAWGSILLSLFLLAEAAYAHQTGSSSGGIVLSFLSFAGRHPDVVLHIAGFSLLGSLAQLFIFSCISNFGSFATTTITISRKFVSVLVSVAIFRHALSWPQWLGVLLVFSGLGIQLNAGHKPLPKHSAEDDAATAAAVAPSPSVRRKAKEQ
jgi:UDP-galactose transporter B1